LENVLWFANGPEDAYEEPTFRRSRAHDYIAEEVKAVREKLGIIEIANFGKHRFQGPGARVFLDRVMAGRIPQPGRIILNPMLTPKGRLYGDLTVACLGEDDFLVLGSGAVQDMHRRWFERYLDGHDLRYSNESSRLHGIAISGPNARELLSRISRDDVSAEGLKFRDIRRTFVAGVPAILARLSFSGELGFEIYVAPEYQLKLYETMIEAGDDLGLKLYGARTLMSLRLEKSWGVWTLDFRPDFTPAESGLDSFIDWEKEFIGKQAAMEEKARGPQKCLVSMTVETQDIDVSNDEAILKDGECVGYVTSGGYAHTIGRSMAMGYVPAGLAKADTSLEVEINGEMYAARVIDKPLYDPAGEKMRS
jgi:dimethylglycine dehydrogenase